MSLLDQTLSLLYSESDQVEGFIPSQTVPCVNTDAPASVDLESVFKRQRAVKGVCGKVPTEPLEHWANQTSLFAAEKIRSFQKTVPNSNETNRSTIFGSENWLDSPATTAETLLRRADRDGKIQSPSSGKGKLQEISVQWKTQNDSVPLFDNAVRNHLGQESFPADSSTKVVGTSANFLCRIPKMDQALLPEERIQRIAVRSISVRWPKHFEKMCQAAAGQIQQLADHLETQKLRDRTVLSFCGSVPGSGCTTIMVCCGRELARRNWKTLLMDANFAHPTLAEWTDIREFVGWESFLLDDENSDAALWNLESNLDLLPLETNSKKKVIHFRKKNNFFDWTNVFRNLYDFILIDSGSLSEPDKCSELYQFGTNGVFLVLGESQQTYETFIAAQQQLEAYGIPQIGIAENRVS